MRRVTAKFVPRVLTEQQIENRVETCRALKDQLRTDPDFFPRSLPVSYTHLLLMEWTNDNIINLIDLYRDHPVLWDCRLKEFKDRNKNIDVLLEIVVSIGVEKDEIERKSRTWCAMFCAN